MAPQIHADTYPSERALQRRRDTINQIADPNVRRMLLQGEAKQVMEFDRVYQQNQAYRARMGLPPMYDDPFDVRHGRDLFQQYLDGERPGGGSRSPEDYDYTSDSMKLWGGVYDRRDESDRRIAESVERMMEGLSPEERERMERASQLREHEAEAAENEGVEALEELLRKRRAENMDRLKGVLETGEKAADLSDIFSDNEKSRWETGADPKRFGEEQAIKSGWLDNLWEQEKNRTAGVREKATGNLPLVEEYYRQPGPGGKGARSQFIEGEYEKMLNAPQKPGYTKIKGSLPEPTGTPWREATAGQISGRLDEMPEDQAAKIRASLGL